MKYNFKKYEDACEKLKDAFLADLYENEEDYEDAYWIGGDIGGVLSWGDWFVDTGNMKDYFKYKLTNEEFFDWYDSANYKDSDRINIKHFKLSLKLPCQ